MVTSGEVKVLIGDRDKQQTEFFVGWKNVASVIVCVSGDFEAPIFALCLDCPLTHAMAMHFESETYH